MTTASFPKTLPLLPGYQFNDRKENYHKTQQFSIEQSSICEKTNHVFEDSDPNLMDTLKSTLNQMNNSNLKVATVREPENTYIPRIQAPWLKFDRKVLRFHAYFQESVVENPIENYRIIPVNFYYYLSDDTIHI